MAKRRAEWHITFPIQKSEQRDDGVYIIGEATGPEIDAAGERMSPELVSKFADQIVSKAEGGTPLVWRDAHAEDGILKDLGELTDAWVDKNDHLSVEIKLDEDHPATNYLLKKLAQGKQFGLSVAGYVKNYIDEFNKEIGSIVRTYTDIVLTEISLTTRPAWTPSFGTILQKAIHDADDEGDGQVEDTTELAEKTTDETASVQEVTKASEAANDASDAAYILSSVLRLLGDDAGEPGSETLKQIVVLCQKYIADSVAEVGSPEDVQETADQQDQMDSMTMMSDSTEETDKVEKAGKKLSQDTTARLLGLFEDIGNTLRDLGVLPIDTIQEPPETEEEIASKSDPETPEVEIAQVEDREAALIRSIEALTAQVATLESRPPTQVPAVVLRTNDEENEFVRAAKSMNSSEGLRLRLALHTQGK